MKLFILLASRQKDLSSGKASLQLHDAQINAIRYMYMGRERVDIRKTSFQSGRSPKVVAHFSATNFSSYTIRLLQLHDKIQIKWKYAWIHYDIAIRRYLMI